MSRNDRHGGASPRGSGCENGGEEDREGSKYYLEIASSIYLSRALSEASVADERSGEAFVNFLDRLPTWKQFPKEGPPLLKVARCSSCRFSFWHRLFGSLQLPAVKLIPRGVCLRFTAWRLPDVK